ncbi:O-antigen ligase family protein [candidate division KSB1 bacterium]|nr:O-antigen ligase family protein [candidate division KSB1 bacterium]
MLSASNRKSWVWLLLFALGLTASFLAIWSLKFKWAFIGSLGLLLPFLFTFVREKRLTLTALMIFVLPLRIDYNFLWGKTYSVSGSSAITFGAFDILLLILLLDWLIDATRFKSPGAIRFFPMISVPTLLLIAVGAASMIYAPDRWLTLYDLIDFIKAYLFFLFLANTIRCKRDLYWVLAAIFAGVITESIIFLLQYYYDISLAFLAIGDVQTAPDLVFVGNKLEIFRPDGTIGHVNSYARYLLMFLPIALSIVLTLRDGAIKWIAALALTLGFTTLIISVTRSAWISFLFALSAVFLLLFSKRLLSLRAIRNTFIASSLALLVAFLYQDHLVDRIVSDDNGAFFSRVVTSKVAWRMIEQHPLFGVGLNNYGKNLDDYWLFSDPYTRIAAVHNNYLLFWAELGVVGFGCLLIFLIAFFLQIRRATSSRYAFVRVVAIGLMGAYVAFVISSLADYYKGNTILISGIWGLAGLTEALNAMSERYSDSFLDLVQQERWRAARKSSQNIPVSDSATL